MVTTILEGLGAVLVVAGVAMVFVPAALIVAGLLFLTVSWRIESAA